MTPDQLDDLFRANSQRGDFEPQPEEWEAMADLLEADERRDRLGRWVSAAWGLLFIGLIAGGIVGAVRYAPGSETADYARADGEDQSTVRPSSAVAKTTPPTPSAIQRSSEVIPTDTDEINAATLPTASPKPSIASVGPRSHTIEVGTSGSLSSTSSSSTPAKSTPATYESAAPVANLNTRERHVGPAAGAIARPTQPIPNRTLLGFGESRFALLPTIQIPDTEVPIPSNTAKAIPPRRVAVYGSVALEANQVELSGPVRPGFLLGPEFRYRLSREWALGFKILYGQKNFIAGGEQLHMAPAEFAGNLKPSSTSCHVDILEFPLSLRYQRAQVGGPPKFYVEASLNSYQLLSERLEFTYVRSVPEQLMSMDISEATGSVGGSVRLGGGLVVASRYLPGVEIGGYLELPFQRSTYGQVSLFSAGVQLGLPILR